jgi:D-alanyl-lipoteichoic acid acyltransferase DltB (MBOAT superfamily)
MGFELLPNFNSPYKANSVADFWRRWHKSVGAGLREYLYIPLGGNKSGGFATYIATTIIFVFLFFILQWYELIFVYAGLTSIYIIGSLIFPNFKKYVHRDLKTENITVTREGIIQLIDFGMARRDGDMAFELGTPGYMSPENMPPEYKALKNMPLGPLTFDMLKASDIWSLGVTIMFMLLPHALTSKLGLELTNEIMDKLFVNSATNKHLTFVQRINQLFTIEDGHFIMNTCSDEIKNIFGPSITMDSSYRTQI